MINWPPLTLALDLLSTNRAVRVYSLGLGLPLITARLAKAWWRRLCRTKGDLVKGILLQSELLLMQVLPNHPVVKGNLVITCSQISHAWATGTAPVRKRPSTIKAS